MPAEAELPTKQAMFDAIMVRFICFAYYDLYLYIRLHTGHILESVQFWAFAGAQPGWYSSGAAL